MTSGRHKAFGHAMRELADRTVVRKTAMTSAVGTLGGYLVPDETAVAINARLAEVSLFHALARQQPMASRECHVPAFDVAAAHATGSSPLFAGMTLSWTAEGAANPESEPSFSDALLVANSLVALVYASNQLVQDGGEPLGAYLEYQFTQAIKWSVEKACFSGTGVGQPAGIVSSPSTATVTRQTASHVTLRDVGQMAGALLPACYANAIWCCHPTALIDIVQLATYQISSDNPQKRLAGILLGRPLYVTEKLPVVGTRGDVMLWDPSMYVLGTRGMEIAVGDQVPTAFQQNQTIFRLTWRGDGQPIARGTSLLADGSTVAGAFVALL